MGESKPITKPPSFVSHTELQANLETCLDAVCDSRNVLLVTRPNASPVVLVSAEEYADLLRTLHRLQYSRGGGVLASVVYCDRFGSIEERVNNR